LTPHEKKLLEMKYIEGLTFQEISKKENLAYSTVHIHVTKALNKLRKRIKSKETSLSSKLNKFRSSKGRKLRRFRIEKNRNRIDTKGELMGITAKGLIARRNNALRRIKNKNNRRNRRTKKNRSRRNKSNKSRKGFGHEFRRIF
jgi:hypothetical protein